MTKDEAVKILKQTHPMYSYVKEECSIYDIEEAYRMAVKALEQDITLAKIRAEIEQLPITDTAIRLVGEIFDKYKIESDEK